MRFHALRKRQEPKTKFVSKQMSSGLRTVDRLGAKVKLQALVYDILPPTTAITDYATCLEKLSANEQCSNGSTFVKPVLNRRFPEITGEDNLTMFSYSRRVKSPESRLPRRLEPICDSFRSSGIDLL